MSSSKPPENSPSSLAELETPQPDRQRRTSRHGSITHHQDDSHQDQGSSLISSDQMPSLEQDESGSSRDSQVTNIIERACPNSLWDHTTTHVRDGAWTQSSRTSQSNVDRKRRLTNSAHNSGRVRTVSGGFHSRNRSSYSSQPEGSPSASFPQLQRDHPTIRGASRANPGESALSALPPLRRNSSNMRRPMSTTREMILPKWQPDSEVSVCPICSRQFTFWFRKHHCRKCGRVVCASCSPHRITIPCQFIVHPPKSTGSTYTVAPGHPVVIDLTGEDGSPSHPDMPTPWANPRRTSSPGLGGGEEVRLCNPCVPDPQPTPQTTMDLAAFLPQDPGRSEVGRTWEQLQPTRSLHLDSDHSGLHGQHLPAIEARELRSQRRRGMVVRAY